jgi:hypothetical protein
MNRRIYKYNDGFSDVFADPSEIDYRMAKASEILDMEAINNWLDLPRDDDGNILESQITPGQQANFFEACHRLLPVIRAGFNIKEFDTATGQGLTMDELLKLWADYKEWQYNVKKNTDDSPTDSTPTGIPGTSSEMSPEQPSPRPAMPTQPPMGSRPPNASTGSISMPGGARQSSAANSIGRTSSSILSGSASMTRSPTP